MNKAYELVVILDPEEKAEEQEKLLGKIKKFISDSEGTLNETKELGKKVLAYPIAKKDTGAFFAFKLSVPAEKVTGLKTKLQLEDQIMRYLLIVDETKPLVSKAKAAKKVK